MRWSAETRSLQFDVQRVPARLGYEAAHVDVLHAGRRAVEVLDLLDRYGFVVAFETIASSELVSVPIDSGGFLGS
jgi:hypothetical protein